MNEIYEFTKVHGLAENTADHSLLFTTDSGKNILLKVEEESMPDAQFIRRAVAENKVVFLAYDPASNLSRFAVPFAEDYVKALEIHQESPQSLEVTLMLRPSYVFLSTRHPRFNELRQLLEAAKTAKRRVWVGTFPGDSQILDVRLPE